MTDGPDWAAIRTAYETTPERLTQLAARFSVHWQAINARVLKEGWKQHDAGRSGDRQSLIDRLITMLERQIGYLEAAMKTSDEKEVTLLGNMARTLEKLIDLDAKVAGKKPDKKRDRELEDIKRKLADRIDQLRQK